MVRFKVRVSVMATVSYGGPYLYYGGYEPLVRRNLSTLTIGEQSGPFKIFTLIRIFIKFFQMIPKGKFV